MDIKIYCIDFILVRKYNNESKIESFDMYLIKFIIYELMKRIRFFQKFIAS